MQSLLYKNNNKLIKAPNSGEGLNIINKNSDIGAVPSAPGSTSQNDIKSISYASYYSWFMNRFCKSFFVDAEAKKKREMLAETLGLNNYLMHLDYIDRQILIEQHSGDINEKIEEIINKNNDKENSNEDNAADNTETELQKDLKKNELSLIANPDNNLNKPLNEEE